MNTQLKHKILISCFLLLLALLITSVILSIMLFDAKETIKELETYGAKPYSISGEVLTGDQLDCKITAHQIIITGRFDRYIHYRKWWDEETNDCKYMDFGHTFSGDGALTISSPHSIMVGGNGNLEFFVR